MPLRRCDLPALLLLLTQELDGLLPAELQPAFQERNGLIRQQLPHRDLQLLTPAVPAAGPVERSKSGLTISASATH